MPAVSSILAGAALAVAAGGMAMQYESSRKSASMQEDAQREAKESALKQEKSADEAYNRANQKRPDAGAILSAAQQAAKGGTGGTMLTGMSGITPDALQLAKTSLLGG